uniref:Uncharacterized protein LOC105119493 n=1 Tax=Rhizophora mucronata TaxID=61149 RepID=A0A2P2JKQ7_RHIMU
MLIHTTKAEIQMQELQTI